MMGPDRRENLIQRITQSFLEIAKVGGESERTQIYPNATVINASPADLPAGYIIVENEQGFYVPAVLVAGLSVSNSDKVNLLYIKGTEPIALQHGTESPAGVNTLDDLSDVTITAPSSSEVLTYNGSIWVNQAAAAFDLIKIRTFS